MIIQLILIITISSIKQGQCQSHSLTAESLDSAKSQFEDQINELKSFDINSLRESSEEWSPNYCSPNKLLENFFRIITPDDYEENQALDMYAKPKHFRETFERTNRLTTFIRNITKKLEPVLNRLQSRISEQMMTIEVPDQCLNALVRVGVGLYNMESWALTFTDTFPSLNGGVEISGFPTGGYDECLMIESPMNDKDRPVIRGKYCPWSVPQFMPGKEEYEKGENRLNNSIIQWINQNLKESQINYDTDKHMPQRVKNFHLTTTFVTEVFTASDYSKTIDTKLPVGICIPSLCSAQDIERTVNKVLYPILRFPIVINPDCDYEGKPVEINEYQWATISIFGALTLLVLISTVYELIGWQSHKKSYEMPFIKKLFRSFGAVSNFQSIFWSDRPYNKFDLQKGIRTILSFWVVLCHEHILSWLPFNSKRIEASTGWGVLMSKNYTHVKNINIIDTFFFIGGMMTCYVMMKKLTKSRGSFNYIQYALYRYCRIIPATLGAILLIFIYPLFGSGPFWTPTTNILYIPCRDNWLSSVLMTSNIDISFPEKYICNTGNWYISTDFQLYLAAPIVFLVLYFRPKLGIIWNVIWVFVGVFICVAPKILWGIPHFLEYPRVDSIWMMGNLFIQYYWRPDPHIVSYAFGMLCGFLIEKKPDLNFGGRIGELFIWMISFSLTFGTLYWTNNLFDPYYPLSTEELLSFMAFSKLTYLCGWFWLFYACATGRGGFVNRFLSWNGWKSTSELSFEICILHPMIILYRVGTARDSVVYTPMFVWSLTVFDYLVTYLLSIVFYVLVSAPFANLVNSYIKSKDLSDQKMIMVNNNKSEFYQKSDQANVKLERIQSNKE